MIYFFSELMFKNANLMTLLFISTAILVWCIIGHRLDGSAVRLEKALDFLSRDKTEKLQAHWVPACSVNICECCCYCSGDTTHVTESCYQLFLVHLQQMQEGLGPGVMAEVGELSQEEEDELGPQGLVVGGPAVF